MKKLNFGCGPDLLEGYDNADIQKGADIVMDFNKFPYPIKDNTYDYVLMKQVLEHLLFPDKVLYEIWRICKNGGIIEITTPYYNNKGAFNDMEHFHYFSDMTFKHFVENTTRIKKEKHFEIISLKLIPTKIGKLLPSFLRKKMSLFIGGLISQVHVKMRVIK